MVSLFGRGFESLQLHNTYTYKNYARSYNVRSGVLNICIYLVFNVYRLLSHYTDSINNLYSAVFSLSSSTKVIFSTGVILSIGFRFTTNGTFSTSTLLVARPKALGIFAFNRDTIL